MIKCNILLFCILCLSLNCTNKQKVFDCENCLKTILYSNGKICKVKGNKFFIGGYLPTITDGIQIFHIYQGKINNNNCTLIENYSYKNTNYSLMQNSEFKFVDNNLVFNFFSIENDTFALSIGLKKDELLLLQDKIDVFQKSINNELLKHEEK